MKMNESEFRHDDSKLYNLRESIFSSKSQMIILDGRIKQKVYFPTREEYERNYQKNECIRNDQHGHNIAIVKNSTFRFSKKKQRKSRLRQIKHLIPSSSKKKELTITSTFSSKSVTKTRKKKMLLIVDQNIDFFVNSGIEDFPLKQQVATLVSHGNHKDDEVRILRYSIEFLEEKLQNFTTPLFRLTGWSIYSSKTIIKVVGYLRRKNTFQFQNYYSVKKKKCKNKTEPSLKCEREDSNFLLMDNPRHSESENVMLSMDKEEEVDIDEMILQAKTLNSKLLTLLDKKKHDKSMAQTKLQEIQNQNETKLRLDIENEVQALQDENDRLRKILLEEENKLREMEQAMAEEESQEGLEEEKESLNNLSNPQQPKSMEQAMVEEESQQGLEEEESLNKVESNPQQPKSIDEFYSGEEQNTTENDFNIKDQKEKELSIKCKVKNDNNEVKRDKVSIRKTMDRLKKKIAKRTLVANNFGYEK